ncbi:MAG: Gfo/Idh/MocA family oxidoreductase [Planctomycetota bacterium]|nr:MAG: Gfo/Idh/MocA family oxidoreductase [Planctomycetota bacterium]
MSNRGRFTRRRFLGTSTRATAAMGLSSMLAAQTATAARRIIGANDRINIGLIGSGGRGTRDMEIAVGAENVACTALCDVAEFRLHEAKARINKKMEQKGKPVSKIKYYDNYQALIESKDIDAVIIGTPDHWHYRPFIDSLDTGKHIYQEKPMAYTIEQGLEMVRAARKHPELTVQIGTQQRSYLNYAQAKEIVDTGILGVIRFVRCFDCRNWTWGDPFEPREVQGKIDWEQFETPCTKKHKYDPYRYFAWRWFWDYAGGLVTDVGVHVMDIVHWMTGETMPKSVVCNGGVYQFKKWETPDVVNAVWDYGTHSITFTSNFTNQRIGDGTALYGTKATMELHNGKISIWSEERKKRDKPLHEFPTKIIQHQHNWIDCIRSGKKPNAPIELGFSSLLPSFLANIAYRTGKKVSWDPVAQKVVM